MSGDLISAEKARELLGSGESSYWRDLAETVIALHARLAAVEADRDAAVAERAALRAALDDLSDTLRRRSESSAHLAAWRRGTDDAAGAQRAAGKAQAYAHAAELVNEARGGGQ